MTIEQAKQDLELAQKIIELSLSNYSQNMQTFHDMSVIYRKTNERLEMLDDVFTNKEKVACVTASGDQIINCIGGGTTSIDAFDISRFPKYQLYLKLAGILALEPEDFIKMFFDTVTTSEIYDDLYFDLIRKNLDDPNKIFWDGLFHHYDWFEIINSALFSSEIVTKEAALRQNKYLQKENYYKVRENISKANIHEYEGDILQLVPSLEGPYNLVYLSNIVFYTNPYEYKRIFSKLKLAKDGIAVSYINTMKDKIQKIFTEEEFNYQDLESTESGILIYKKGR